MSYYESYDAPFYGIASGATLIVPKGAANSYTAAGWGDFFNIDESEVASLTVKSVTPSNESYFKKNASLSFSITFKEDLQLVNVNPEVQIRQDYIYNTVYIKPTGTPEWTARLDNKNTQTIFGNDSDGFVGTFVAKEGKSYYVTIPAGVVKDNTGAVNDQITILYYGPKVVDPTGIDTLKSEITNNGKVVGRYNLNGQAVNAAQKGVQILKYADGTVKKVVIK